VIGVVAKPYKHLFLHRNAKKVYYIFVHVNSLTDPLNELIAN